MGPSIGAKHMNTAEDTTYNGWSNWETWNAALWLDNDEDIYKRSRNMEAEELEVFCRDLWAQAHCTPDDADLDKVDWEEIAKARNSE